MVIYKVHGAAHSRLLWFDLFHWILLVAPVLICMFILWCGRAGGDVLDVIGAYWCHLCARLMILDDEKYL